MGLLPAKHQSLLITYVTIFLGIPSTSIIRPNLIETWKRKHISFLTLSSGHSGRSRFESQPGHWLSLLRVLEVWSPKANTLTVSQLRPWTLPPALLSIYYSVPSIHSIRRWLLQDPDSISKYSTNKDVTNCRAIIPRFPEQRRIVWR
jgi:hypothetical protein